MSVCMLIFEKTVSSEPRGEASISQCMFYVGVLDVVRRQSNTDASRLASC